MNPNLVSVLVDLANKYAGGHLTIMKFTTNWRIGLGTPDCISGNGLPEKLDVSGFNMGCRKAIESMYEARTFEEAAKKAIIGLCDGKRIFYEGLNKDN